LDSALHSDKSELTAVEVYTKHADFIRRVIRSHVKDENQADDIFQDLFLRLVTNPIGPEVEHIERYLYRATLNEIINSARRIKKFEGRVGRYALNADVVSRQMCPEDSVIDADEIVKTFRFIREQRSRKAISERQAQALNLHYTEGHQIKDIARMMGVQKSSASQYVSMGLARVRRAATTVGENTL
jgi:RNA polymerase sigma factor (sigma-70 family)